MARWGRADFKQFEEMNKRLEQLSAMDFDHFCRDAASMIAQMLSNKVKKRTPVGVIPTLEGPKGKAIRKQYWSGHKGGTLRDAWTILPVEKQGNTYVVTVANNTEYAAYVEYGHRQTPGRYVPALGKRLKASWVKGRFMLTISTQEVEEQAPAKLEEMLYAFLKEVF